MAKRLRLCVGFAAVATVAVAGCTFTPSHPASTSPTSSVDFPYPPQHDILEVAVPLDPQQAEAANFALEVRLARSSASYGQPDQVEHYNRMVADQLKGSFLGITPPQETTGGETYRAVHAIARAGDAVEVDVCVYASPGVFGLLSGETRPHLIPNPDGYGITRLTVQKTTAQSATGETPAEPRWLAIDYDLTLSFNMKEADRVCTPFRPDPWVQRMPGPTAPLPSPTPG